MADESLPRADAARLEHRILESGRFCTRPGGCVSRVAFSDADIAAWEYTTPADLANGADALLRTLLSIDRGALGAGQPAARASD